MDILNSLQKRNWDNQERDASGGQGPFNTLDVKSRPETITELIDAQIGYHQQKIDDLKAAKEAISPEVEKALNALAKIS